MPTATNEWGDALASTNEWGDVAVAQVPESGTKVEEQSVPVLPLSRGGLAPPPEPVATTPAEQQAINIAMQRVDPRWNVRPPEPTLGRLIGQGMHALDEFVRPAPPVPQPEPLLETSDQRTLNEARNRILLKERLGQVESPLFGGTRESVAGGVKAMTTPSGLATLGGAVAAPQFVLPALLTTVVPEIPDTIERIQKARESGDRYEYYKGVTDLSQQLLVAGGSAYGLARPLAPALPRARAALAEEPTPTTEPAPPGEPGTPQPAPVTEVPSAIQQEAETPVRDVQQPSGASQGAGEVPTDVRSEEAGPRGGVDAGDAGGAQEAARPEVPLTPAEAPLTYEELSAIEAKTRRGEILTPTETRRIIKAQEAFDERRRKGLEEAIAALPPEQQAQVRGQPAPAEAPKPAPVVSSGAQIGKRLVDLSVEMVDITGRTARGENTEADLRRAQEIGAEVQSIRQQQMQGEAKPAPLTPATHPVEAPAPAEAPAPPETQVVGKVRGMTEDDIRSAVMQALVEGGMVKGLKRGAEKEGHYVVIPPDKTVPGDEPMAMGPFESKRAAKEFLDSEVGAPGAKVVEVRRTAPAPEAPKPAPAPGPGAASPSEFDPAHPLETSIKNAVTAEKRATRGMPAVEEEAARKWGDVWESVKQQVEDDPGAPDRLITSLRDKPRAVTDREDAMLLHQQVSLEDQFNRRVKMMVDAAETGGDTAIAEHRIELARLSDQLLDLYDVDKSVGRETARGLNARKMMADETYSLVRMELAKRAVNDGRPLIDAERAQITALKTKIDATQKAFDEHVARTETRIRELETQHAADELKIAASREAREDAASGTVRDLDAERAGIIGSLGERAPNTPLRDLRPWIRKLALNLVRSGITERDPLINAVHDVLKDAIPGIDIRTTMDAISGYGDFRPLDPEAAKAQLRDLSGQMQNVAKLEDLLARKALKKTGPERKTPSDEERRLTKLVNEYKKRYGVTVTDPAAQLKSALATIKTRLTNQIADLDFQIKTGKRIVKGNTKVAYDAEAQALVERRDALKAQFDEVFGTEMADEQRVASAKSALERNIAELQRRIDAGETRTPRKPSKTPITEQLQVLRDQRDAARAQLEALRDADTALQEERAVKALNTSIADLERRLNENDLFTAEREKAAATAATAPLLERKSALTKELAERRAASPEGIARAHEQRKAALVKAIAENERRLRERDLSRPPQRARSPEEQALATHNASLLKQLADLRKASPEGVARAEAQRIEAITKEIADLERRIAANELAVTKKPARTLSADEQRHRDVLNQTRIILQDLREKAGVYDADRIAKATKSVDAAIDESIRQINEGDLAAKKRAPGATSPELEAKRAELADLQRVKQELRNAAKPKKTPEQIALASLKTRLLNANFELHRRITEGDLSAKPSRRSVALDPTAQSLKADNLRLREQFQRDLLKDRLKHRTAAERWQDTALGLRRLYILSSPVTLAKLTAAAVARMVSTPIEEGIGAALGKIPGVAKVARRAPIEGRFSPVAEAKAITSSLTLGMRDSAQILKTGRSDLERLYGGRTAEGGFREGSLMPRTWLNFFGELHGAFKAPVKRAAFERAMQKQIEFGIRNGIDVTDPITIAGYGVEAYKAANRSIFLQDNLLVSKINSFLATRIDPSTGRPTAASKAFSTAGRLLLPIVRVPTNIVAETMQYATGLATGNVRLARALHRGIETLPPAEADLIMRQLKKGSIGGAFLIAGYLLPEFIGGYYQPHEKRDKGDVKVGAIGPVPQYVLHSPLLETLQLGSTVRRVADSSLTKKHPDEQGLVAGIVAGALGLAEELPGAREMVDLVKVFDPHERGAYFGELVKSLIVPQMLQFIARQMDKDSAGEVIPRKPGTVLEHIETGIPGLRQDVPEPRRASR